MCIGKIQSTSLDQISYRTSKFAKKKVELVTNRKVEIAFKDSEKISFQDDVLAISTYHTKVIFFNCERVFRKIQDSVYYRIIFHTTQPAHVITALAVLMVSLMLIPSEKRSNIESPIWSLLYLGSFSVHFGAQIWMTFVSGLSLYFALPRHTFGNIQKVLFPKYFLINSILSLVTLYVFLRAHNYHIKSASIASQVAAMTLCFLIELLIRLYLTPPLLRLMTIKNKIESQAGIGMEIGKLVLGELTKCPHYMTIHKAFRKVHMTIAMGNLITMACTIFQLYYLSQKLCVLV